MEMISRFSLTFLLNAVWQIPVAAVVATLVCRWMRNTPARHRYIVWAAALVVAITLPLASTRRKQQLPAPHLTISLPSPATPKVLHPPTPALPTLSPTSAMRTVSLTETTAKYLLSAYFLFLLFRLLGLFRAAVRAVRVRRSAQAVALSEQLHRVHRRCQEAFGLMDVQLLFSAQIPAPATVGRTIILPQFLLAEPSESVLTTAIGHEMAHIVRHDFSCHVLFELLFLPVSFQPAASSIRRGIQRTREIACDELVTSHLIDARTYAQAMVNIAASITSLPRTVYTLGMFDGDGLEDRVRRLLHQHTTSFKSSRLLLTAGLALLAVCAAIVSGLAFTARAQGFASGPIKQGEAAYRRHDYQEATRQFTSAVQLEPQNLRAKLLLADALLAQYVPGTGETTDALLAAARQQYLEVLARDPSNRQALHAMLSVATTGKRWAEAHEWALKAIRADHSDKFAYYGAGAADWAMVWPDVASARQAAGMTPQDAGIISDASLRQSIQEKRLAQVEDGLQMLSTALQIDSDYVDAMAYTNLLYRMEAAIADTEAQAAGSLVQADRWVAQALKTKKRLAQNPPSTVQEPDVDQLPPGPPSPPPPPPPPPPGWHGTLPAPPLVGGTPPSMPEVAKTGASGLVQLSVVIAKDGTVRHIDALNGPPALIPPIVEGVHKWVFQPTMANGVPVEVTTMISLRTLSHSSPSQ